MMPVWDNLASVAAGAWDYIVYLDINYLSWLLWLVRPVLFLFILPSSIAVLLYLCAIFLWIFQYRRRLQEAYQHALWEVARRALAAFWDAIGHYYHGFEVDGLEKIPSDGSALIVYYHGVIPIDIYYAVAKILLVKGRNVHAVGDKFLFKIPGWNRMMQVFHVTAGTIEKCVEILDKNNLLAIAPGGVREALFGDENYTVMWGKRSGFAQVALQAKVPIIPMFTENVREVFRTPYFCRKLLRSIYEKTRLPLVPVYGCFPVKLITHFGDPIYPEEGMTAEDFKQLVKTKVEELIFRHQRLPGNIPRALWQRFFRDPKKTS